VVLVARELTPSLTVQLDTRSGRRHRHGPGDPHLAQRHPGPLPRSPLRGVASGTCRRAARRRRADPGRPAGAGDPRPDRGGEGGVPSARLPDPRVGAGAGAPRAPPLGDPRRVAGGAPRQHRPPGRGGERARPRRGGGGAVPHRVPGGGARHAAAGGGAVPGVPPVAEASRPAGGDPHLRSGRRQVPRVPPHGKEENPFLGWRAIRVCLDEPEIFRTQLRALLRASASSRRRPHHAPADQRDRRGGADARAAGGVRRRSCAREGHAVAERSPSAR
jgi:hypothetical protein